MNNYILEIKPYTDAPIQDYEVEADTLDEAIDILFNQLQGEYTKEWLKNNIEEIKLCERCGGDLGTRTIGDEYYDYCGDCHNITN